MLLLRIALVPAPPAVTVITPLLRLVAANVDFTPPEPVTTSPYVGRSSTVPVVVVTAVAALIVSPTTAAQPRHRERIPTCVMTDATGNAAVAGG